MRIRERESEIENKNEMRMRMKVRVTNKLRTLVDICFGDDLLIVWLVRSIQRQFSRMRRIKKEREVSVVD